MSNIEVIDIDTRVTNDEWERGAATIGALEDLIRLLKQEPRLAARLSLSDQYLFTSSEEEWKELNGTLGAFKKDSNQHYLRALKHFGGDYRGFDIISLISKEETCQAVVTGTQTVKKMVPMEDVEYVEIEVEEDIVEWKCPERWTD